MVQMTHNEYKEFTKECASKLYNSYGYSMQDFKRDTDNVEILPFDMSRFKQLSENSIKWINAYFAEEDVDKHGNFLLRGFTYHERTAVQNLNLHYGDYADCYSFFAYNADEFLIFTYCEGDITLTILTDKESYEKEYAETYAWYKETRG